MTEFEHNQDDKVFHHAGYIAYGLGSFPVANPYRGSHLFKLWAAGYRRAELNAGGKNYPLIRRIYSVAELDEVECPNCGDIYFEKQRCQKCNPEMIEISVKEIRQIDRRNNV